jgi:23S rRNA pseudouridine1911/1915/1917 synthase
MPENPENIIEASAAGEPIHASAAGEPIHASAAGEPIHASAAGEPMPADEQIQTGEPIHASAAGERLDRYLRVRLPDLSRAALAEFIGRGGVRVNGRRASKGQLLRLGDRIAIEVETSPPSAANDELQLDVLYEDRWLVAVDKPAGAPSHPLRVGERGTVASALLERYPEMAGVGYRKLEPGLLHRLDTDTSGVLIAARDAATFARLRTAHARGELDKRYLALCSGAVSPQRAQAFLRADQRRVRIESSALTQGRAIETEILSAEPRSAFSLVQVRVAFAARHQVRAHLAALGHPIAGDQLYGGASLPGLTRQFLHASEVTLQHPASDERLSLHAPLPRDLQTVLDTLPP